MHKKTLSWRLWHAIFHNSLPQFPTRIFDGAPVSPPQPGFNGRAVLRDGAVILLVIAVFVVFPSVFPRLMASVLMLFIPFSGMFAGLAAAIRITRMIFLQQAQGRYDLLLLTPSGVLGVHWVIVSHLMRTDFLLRWFRWIPMSFFIMTAFMIFMLLVTVFFMLPLGILRNEVSQHLQWFFQSACILMIIVLLYTEYIQSVVIGVLVGVLLPTYADREQETTAYAVASAAFITLQMGFYVLAFLGFGFFFLPLMDRMMRAESYHLLFVMLAAAWVVIGVLREVTIRWLWHKAEDRLWFDATESGINA